MPTDTNQWNGGIAACPVVLMGPAYRREGRSPAARAALADRVRKVLLREDERGGLTQLCRLWRSPGRTSAGATPALRSATLGTLGGPFGDPDDFILFALGGHEIHFSTADVAWIVLPAHSITPGTDPPPAIFAAPKRRGGAVNG